MVYQQSTNYTPVLQADPIVPCDVQFILTAPDSSKSIAQGKGDRFGYFMSKEMSPAIVPNITTPANAANITITTTNATAAATSPAPACQTRVNHSRFFTSDRFCGDYIPPPQKETVD